jgi:hypothetical protein
LSAYHTSAGEKLWVITEADRSSTCILLPEEYWLAQRAKAGVDAKHFQEALKAKPYSERDKIGPRSQIGWGLVLSGVWEIDFAAASEARQTGKSESSHTRYSHDRNLHLSGIRQ